MEMMNQKLKNLSLFILSCAHLDVKPVQYVGANINKKNFYDKNTLFHLSQTIMYLMNVALTLLLINRWLVSGHFPLSNLYESLIFLSWSFTIIYTITSFTLHGEAKKTLLPTISWSVAPITLLTCGYAIFCVPQELQKAESLVPALQSNWLIMHVSVMILSYASLILGSLFAFSLLLIVLFDNYKLPFDIRSNKLRSNGSELVSQKLGAPTMRMTLPAANTDSSSKHSLHDASKAYIQEGSTRSAEILDFNSDGISFSFKEDFVAEGKEPIKNHNFLDNLSYRFIGLGFALLTLGIISGAVWANSAWGSYWSWDPKETWAFITWLTYAIYLHLRISKGWYGKQSAFVALFGFFVVWFCYLGVNLFGKGLHSYAFV